MDDMPSTLPSKVNKSADIRECLPADYRTAYDNVREKAKGSKSRVLLDTAKIIHYMATSAVTYLTKSEGHISDCLNNDSLARRILDNPYMLPALLSDLNTGLEWFEHATRAQSTSRKSPARSEFLELPPDINACLVLNVSRHLMRRLSALADSKGGDVDSVLHFAHQMVLLHAATLSLRLPELKKEIFRKHGQTVSRKLGKSEDEAKQIVLSLAKTMLAEHPDEYRWKTEKKAGQIRLNHLADSITNHYNAPLRKQARSDRITISSTQKYLRKLVREGELN